MPARTKPRKYYADDLTHTVSERLYEDWGTENENSYRLKCMGNHKFMEGNYFKFLLDTRAKDFFVCQGCYYRLFKDNDWKAWEVGY